MESFGMLLQSIAEQFKLYFVLLNFVMDPWFIIINLSYQSLDNYLIGNFIEIDHSIWYHTFFCDVKIGI